MRWLRARLLDKLQLPELGEGWLLLQHRWSLGGTKKAPKLAEIVAVDTRTGQVGFVALDAAMHEALALEWTKSCGELAPFFTSALQGMAALYDAGVDPALAVTPEPDAAFTARLSSDGLTVL